MKSKFISIFYSITTAYILFALLAAVFAVGSQLAGVSEIKLIFKEMNATDVWSCFGAIIGNTTLLIWLIILIVIAVFLFFNTLCCTTQLVQQSFLNRSKNRAPSRLKIMAFIHVVALFVIIFHALDVGLIQRHKPVQIMESESLTLGKYRLNVDKVFYETDRTFITESEKGKRTPSYKIPRKQFSIEGNRAEISLYQDDVLVKTSEIRLFSPVKIGGSFYILDGFFIPHGTKNIGISIHYMYNPLVYPFFIIYTILFAALLLQWFKNRYRAPKSNTNNLQGTATR